MKQRLLLMLAVLTWPGWILAQQTQASPIVDARINRYCHPPDECVLRGALLWDSTNAIPRYSEIMRSVGIESDADVKFSVRPDGTVDPASIEVSRLTNRAFEQPIHNAVRTWKFRVATSDRVTEPIPTALELMFVLAHGCAESGDRTISALSTRRTPTRLLILACWDDRPRH
jgi:TonB family protein